MTWKTEIDRTVHEALRRAFDDRRSDGSRAIALANDFVALAPARELSHFALGLVEELTHLAFRSRNFDLLFLRQSIELLEDLDSTTSLVDGRLQFFLLLIIHL